MKDKHIFIISAVALNLPVCIAALIKNYLSLKNIYNNLILIIFCFVCFLIKTSAEHTENKTIAQISL